MRILITQHAINPIVKFHRRLPPTYECHGIFAWCCHNFFTNRKNLCDGKPRCHVMVVKTQAESLRARKLDCFFTAFRYSTRFICRFISHLYSSLFFYASEPEISMLFSYYVVDIYISCDVYLLLLLFSLPLFVIFW